MKKGRKAKTTRRERGRRKGKDSSTTGADTFEGFLWRGVRLGLYRRDVR